MKHYISLTGIVLASGSMTSCKIAPKKVQPAKPNILFVVADNASYPHFSANGCSWMNTPGFDRLAREGIRFANCYTPNSKSAPARSCILTGLYSWQLREAANHLPNFPLDIKVVTEVLQEVGYYVGYTNKGWAPGFEGQMNGKPRLLTGKPYNQRKLTPPVPDIRTNDYTGNFGLKKV